MVKLVCFFGLKCGALFEPLDEEMVKKQLETAKVILNVLSNPNKECENKNRLLSMLENVRREGNLSFDQINKLIKKANNKKDMCQQVLKMIENDKNKEIGTPINRVGKTYSGVEITHFCTDDNIVLKMKKEWMKNQFRYPVGQTLFWYKIVPIISKLQDSVGCQFVFLFAADATPDNTLVNYYNVSLKFDKLENVGTSKPYYDLCCEFMSQEVNKIKNERDNFLSNFNPDGDDIVI